MKRIRLLGAMSWESSIEYERIINETVRERLGVVHSPDLIIRSYDFAEIEALHTAGDWDQAARLPSHDAAMLEQAGAQLIVLCTNTMHRLADAIIPRPPCRSFTSPTPPRSERLRHGVLEQRG